MADEPLYTVVTRGDRVKALEGYRDAQATEMVRLQHAPSTNKVAGRDFSALGNELRTVMALIVELTGVREFDKLKARRDAQRSE